MHRGHFWTVAQHLRESLEQLQVPAGLIEECIANIAPAASVFPEPGGAPVPGPEPVPAEGTPAAVSWRVSEILRFFPPPPPPPLFCSGFGSGVFESGTREQKKAHSLVPFFLLLYCFEKQELAKQRAKGSAAAAAACPATADPAAAAGAGAAAVGVEGQRQDLAGD